MPASAGNTVLDVRVIAHRGASYCCPENTLSAFDRAIIEQADGIELDIQLTSDGVPVVFHDHSMRKVGSPQQRLFDLSYAQLQQVDFGSWFDKSFAGERVPPLDKVLDRYASKMQLNIELKPVHDATRNEELLDKAIGQIREAGVSDRVQILCFDAALLKLAHQRAPEMRYVLNAFSARSSVPEAVQMPWLQAIDVDIRWLTPQDGQSLRTGGHELMCYTINTKAQLKKALAAGVNAVIGNSPAKMREWLDNGTSA